MARIGMDADVVESVGKQLKHQGQSVTSVIRSVDALIDRAGTNWWGAHGRDVVHQWRTVHRPALLRVAGAVDGLGQSALNNAHDQRGVSQGSAGAGTGLNPGSGSAGGIDDALHALGEHTGAVAWAGLLVGLGSNANLTGRYSRDAIAVRTALSNLSGGRATLDDLRYKKWLNGPFTTNGILDTVHKSPAWKGLKGGMSALGTALTIERLVSPSSDWWTRGHATVDLAADQMKTSGPLPVRLGGMALSAANISVEEGRKIDWSTSGLQQTASYIRSNPTVLAEEFGKSVITVLPKVIL